MHKLLSYLPLEKFFFLINSRTDEDLAKFEDQIRTKVFSHFSYLGMDFLEEMQRRARTVVMQYVENMRIKIGKSSGYYEPVNSLIERVFFAPYAGFGDGEGKDIKKIGDINQLASSLMMLIFLNISTLDPEAHKELEEKFRSDLQMDFDLTSKAFQKYFMWLLLESEQKEIADSAGDKTLN